MDYPPSGCPGAGSLLLRYAEVILAIRSFSGTCAFSKNMIILFITGQPQGRRWTLHMHSCKQVWDNTTHYQG